MFNKICSEIILSFWSAFRSLKIAFFGKFKLKKYVPKPHLMSEESKTITEVLDGILNKQRQSLYQTCNWYEDDSVPYAFYNLAVSHLEAKLGVSIYKGKGGGNVYCKATRPSQIGYHDYSHSLEMAWWEMNDDIFYVLLTGHDADSLLCFKAHYVYSA